MTEKLRGVVTPLLTPYNDDLSLAEDLYLAHAATCLEQGAHYLSPFGTTSEAPSNSPKERMHMLEQLVNSSTAPAETLMPGTGLCSLEETETLTRHASELGCAAAMVLPPFFFSNPPEEGLYAAFAGLIERLGAACPKVILYNIPQNTGVPLSPQLVARLNIAFPEQVVAYKDSSGDWENTKAVIEAAPDVAVFPGSESVMSTAMPIGGAGCISASCNSNTRMIRAQFDALDRGDHEGAKSMQASMDHHRITLQNLGLIGGLKALKAFQSGDQRWLNLRPPNVNAKPEDGEILAQTLP